MINDHKQLQNLAKSLVDKINSRFGTTIVAELRPPEYIKLDPRLEVTSFGIKDCTSFIDDGRRVLPHYNIIFIHDVTCHSNTIYRFFDRQSFLDDHSFKDLPSAIKSTGEAIAKWKELFADGMEVVDCKSCFLSTFTA